MDETSMRSSVGGKKSRKRLVPWLYKMLDSGTVPGLKWRSREEKIWQLPWKSHATTRWGDQDAFMLREYAKVLYGYDGVEPEQAKLKQWKELLRNNLRSLKDVEELPDFHEKDGNTPYKVYKFVENSTENAAVVNSRGRTGDQMQQNRAATCSPGSVDSNFSVDTMLSNISSPNNLGSVKSQNTPEACPAMPHQPDFNDNNSVPVFDNLLSPEPNNEGNGDVLNTWSTMDGNGQFDLVLNDMESERFFNQICPVDPSCNINPSFRSRSPISHVNQQHDGIGGRQNVTFTPESTAASCLVDNHMPVMGADGGQFPVALSSSYVDNFLASLKPQECNTASTDSKYPLMTVEVRYYDHVVLKQAIRDTCFRLAFVANEGDREAIDTSPYLEQFGMRDVNTVQLPLTDHCQQLTEPQAKNIKKVLNNLKRGIIFQYTENKDIVGTRYCKAVPLFLKPNSSSEFIKMERMVPIKIYDANEVAKTFKVDHNQQPMTGSCCVNLSFSMTPDSLASFKQVLSITIYHMEHARLGKQTLESMSSSMEPVCSLSDSFDQILSLREDLRKDEKVDPAIRETFANMVKIM